MKNNIELINPNIPRGTRSVRCAVFDFDGTLSLLREGWTHIMLTLMLDRLMRTPTHESEAELLRRLTDLIYQTAGQQTIYQMIRLTEEIEKRGGKPDTPETYKQIFAAQLLARVNERVAAIESGNAAPTDWIVPGAIPLLQSLRERNVTCYIASGTDETFVKSEARLLGLAPHFVGIFGAHEDYRNHSKKIIIGNIVEKHALREGELVTFGDGAPELGDTKAVGGIAVGVATDEEKRRGVDPRKRAALLQAGADIIMPDFRDHAELVELLFATQAG